MNWSFVKLFTKWLSVFVKPLNISPFYCLTHKLKMIKYLDSLAVLNSLNKWVDISRNISLVKLLIHSIYLQVVSKNEN